MPFVIDAVDDVKTWIIIMVSRVVGIKDMASVLSTQTVITKLACRII